MPAEKASALVLRTYDFSETSRVVVFFSREFGKLRTLAKGAKRLKGPFEAGLDLLSVVSIVFLRKSSESLDLLTEASLVERFGSLRQDLRALYSGYYVAELLSELTHDHDPHPTLYDAALETLRRLGQPDQRDRALIRFELTCLREVGHAPALDRCVSCDRLLEGPGLGWFSLVGGGLICDPCRPGRSHVVALSPAALQSLRILAAEGSTAWQRLVLTTGAQREIRRVLGETVSHLMGRRPRTLGYLGDQSP